MAGERPESVGVFGSGRSASNGAQTLSSSLPSNDLRSRFALGHTSYSSEFNPQATRLAISLKRSNDPDHQGIGDVPSIGRFELAASSETEVVDGEIDITETLELKPARVVRRVDSTLPCTKTRLEDVRGLQRSGLE